MPEKHYFSSNLNVEDTTDSGYNHAKRVCDNFAIKNLAVYHDLYLKCNTLLLADVSKNFRKMCLRNLSIRSCKIYFGPRISLGKSFIKRIKVELELLTDIDLLLIAQKGIRVEIYHSINRYVKVNNKYMEDYNKIKELSYLKYWHVNNFYGCECLKSWQ